MKLLLDNTQLDFYMESWFSIQPLNQLRFIVDC